jgi:hypothetical protein
VWSMLKAEEMNMTFLRLRTASLLVCLLNKVYVIACIHVGTYKRLILTTGHLGAVCLLYLSWHSIQSDNPVLVAYSNTVYKLQIQV